MLIHSGPVTASSFYSVQRRARGYGVVAMKAFQPGEMILEVQGLIRPRATRFSIQIGPSEHLEPLSLEREPAPADPAGWRFLNHSCEPNAWFSHPRLVCCEPIERGDPITFNYNTTEFELSEPFSCSCGAPSCLGWIRGYRHLEKKERDRLGPWLSPT